MHGIVLVDKPHDWTSFDVVNYVRKMVAGIESTKPRQIKVGHSGTLDPLATGLLVILVGADTKRMPEFSKLDKTYEVTMRLGQTSTTGDEEGEKTTRSDRQPTVDEITAAFKQFTGIIQQTPPRYSAVKVKGQRAYRLARSGQSVQLEPRAIHIYHLKLATYTYPLVQFTTKVSSGTYVRALVEDIGEMLQTGAFVADLRRLQVGTFTLKEAALLSSLTLETLVNRLQTG